MHKVKLCNFNYQMINFHNLLTIKFKIVKFQFLFFCFTTLWKLSKVTLIVILPAISGTTLYVGSYKRVRMDSRRNTGRGHWNASIYNILNSLGQSNSQFYKKDEVYIFSTHTSVRIHVPIVLFLSNTLFHDGLTCYNGLRLRS